MDKSTSCEGPVYQSNNGSKARIWAQIIVCGYVIKNYELPCENGKCIEF